MVYQNNSFKTESLRTSSSLLTYQHPIIDRLKDIKQLLDVAGNKHQIFKIQTLLEDYKTELIISRYSKDYIDRIYTKKASILIMQATEVLKSDQDKVSKQLFHQKRQVLLKNFLFAIVMLLVLAGIFIII